MKYDFVVVGANGMQGRIVSKFLFDITCLTNESIPLFSENSLPTRETFDNRLESVISFSRFMLERVQMASEDLGFPKNTSSFIGRIILHISPARFSIKFMS